MAMSVSNLDNSIEWYHRMLGFELVEKTEFKAINARVAFIQGLGMRLELLQIDGGYKIPDLFADPPKHMLLIGNKALVLYTDDLTAVTQRLEEQQAVFAFKKQKLTDDGLRTTLIRDIDGNFISILGKE
jgi:catechol 2,3-dioxygenase-like lactoylglutathione lyase family enzyme